MLPGSRIAGCYNLRICIPDTQQHTNESIRDSCWRIILFCYFFFLYFANRRRNTSSARAFESFFFFYISLSVKDVYTHTVMRLLFMYWFISRGVRVGEVSLRTFLPGKFTSLHFPFLLLSSCKNQTVFQLVIYIHIDKILRRERERGSSAMAIVTESRGERKAFEFIYIYAFIDPTGNHHTANLFFFSFDFFIFISSGI